MERQLLALIRSLGRHHPRGEADASACLQQLRIGHAEFFALLTCLEDKGYLEDETADGMLKLSAKGIAALDEE